MTVATMTFHDSLALLAGGAVCLAGFGSWLNAIGDFFWMGSLRGRLVMTTAMVILVGGGILLVVISRVAFGAALPPQLALLILLWMVPVLTRFICNAIAVRSSGTGRRLRHQRQAA